MIQLPELLAGHGQTRGQSEVIGYVLVFGLVITLITSAMTLGLPALQTAQQDAEIDVTERNFERIDEEALIVGSGGGRSIVQTETPPGTLSHGNVTTIVTVEGPVDGSTETFTLESQPITYQGEQGSKGVVYDMGLITRTTQMPQSFSYRSIPDETMSPTRLIKSDGENVDAVRWRLPALEIEASHTIHGNRDIDYRVAPSATDRPRGIRFDETDSITITVQTTEEAVWNQYFEYHPAFEVTSIDSTGGAREKLTVETTQVAEYSIVGVPAQFIQQ